MPPRRDRRSRRSHAPGGTSESIAPRAHVSGPSNRASGSADLGPKATRRPPRIGAFESGAELRARFSSATHLIIAAFLAKTRQKELSGSIQNIRRYRVAAIKRDELYFKTRPYQQVTKCLRGKKRKQRVLPSMALKDGQTGSF